jgi:hypothetical protein
MIKNYEHTLNLPGLLQSLRRNFINIAASRTSGQTTADNHEAIMRHAKLGIINSLPRSCSFCIIREPVYMIDCNHRFCESCVVQKARIDLVRSSTITKCPICIRRLSMPIVIQPPTAGSRYISIGPGNTDEIFRFLERLSGSINLRSIKMSSYFDTGSGSGTGM